MHPLTLIGWTTLTIGFVSAGWIAYDIFGAGHRQKMGVMEAVWPVNAFYLGPAAVIGYLRWGRPSSPVWQQRHPGQEPDRPRWSSVALGTAHCGAGCTLGDILAEFAVFWAGLAIAGQVLWAEFIGDYLLALLLGILFQFYAIAPMRGLSWREGLPVAAKVDFASLTAFEVGLFGWMALSNLVLFRHHPVHPDSPVYWLSMQVGMVLGYLTSFPVNRWLIDRGTKEAM